MNRTEQINEFEWLLGSWANITRYGEYYETWTREGDSAF